MTVVNIGLVTEGPRDIDFIEALLYHLYPDANLAFYYLQPEDGGDKSENGCGWKGVRTWCEKTIREFSSIEEYKNAISPRLDLLIIHLDADIVYENDINEATYEKIAEPPKRLFDKNLNDKYDQVDVALKVAFLLDYINYWFDGKVTNHEYMTYIPSDNFEAWVLLAYTNMQYHTPPIKHIEKLEKPDDIIAQASKFCGIKVSRKKGGKLRKETFLYQNHFIPKVIEKWSEIKDTCQQARVFEDTLKKSMST